MTEFVFVERRYCDDGSPIVIAARYNLFEKLFFFEDRITYEWMVENAIEHYFRAIFVPIVCSNRVAFDVVVILLVPNDNDAVRFRLTWPEYDFYDPKTSKT